MKIYATRIPAPEKGEHGTKWQVVVAHNDTVETFDAVDVEGHLQFVALDDEGENPRVYAVPSWTARVIARRGEVRFSLQ